MWFSWPRAPFQDVLKLVPDGSVTAWDNIPYLDVFLPADASVRKVQLGWFDSRMYSWKGTLKSTQPNIGAIHIAFGLNNSNQNSPDPDVPAGQFIAHGTLSDSLNIELGGRFNLKLQRFAANFYPNGGRAAERAIYGNRRPYLPDDLNPPVNQEYFVSPSVQVGASVDCTKVTLTVDGSPVRDCVTPFTITPLYNNVTYISAAESGQDPVLASSFCSAGLGIIRNESEHTLYAFVSFGGFGARTITWAHEITGDDEDYLSEPLRLTSSNGAVAYVTAAKPGQFLKRETMRPDPPGLAANRYLKTFAAYRNRAENFAWPLASDSATGIADVDCAGSVSILRSSESLIPPSATLCYPQAVKGYDLADTAFVANPTRNSNLSSNDSDNVLLSEIEVSIPSGFLTGANNTDYARNAVTPSTAATWKLIKTPINNYYLGEAAFNWTYSVYQTVGLERREVPIHIHKKIKALCFLERRFQVSNRRASSITAAVFASITKLHLRIVFAGVPAPGQGTTPPGDVVLFELQAYRDLTDAEQTALLGGGAVTINRWDFGHRILGFAPFNGTNLTATVRAVGAAE